MFTAELAAWCAEIHEHLRRAETDVGVQLILMGGNGASLARRRPAARFQRQRLPDRRDSRGHQAVDGSSRRALPALDPLFVPRRYEPIRKVAQLDMVAP